MSRLGLLGQGYAFDIASASRRGRRQYPSGNNKHITTTTTTATTTK